MKINHFIVGLLCVASFVGCQQTAENDFMNARRDRYLSAAGNSVSLFHGATSRGGLNKNFYYLTGSQDTTAMLVLDPSKEEQAVIYSDNPELNAVAELPILPLAQLSEDMQQAMGQGRPLKMESDRAAKYQRMKHLMSFTDNADSIVFSHRMIKDAYEIAQLRKACRYTAEGINEMMRTLRLGMTEQEMENAMRESFLQQGADGVSFSQAASGANATSVHAGVTEHVLADGEMAVIDIGALCGPYTADISRSFPVNGTFTPQQRQIYEIVLKAQQLGMSYFLPGNNMLVGEEQAGNLIMRELYALGLVTDTTAVWQRNFYIQHGFGHHIGLDIHDVWYWFQRSIPKEERIYQPGMVLTFEPGIYFPANYLTSLPERYKDKVAPEELTAFIAAVEPIYNQYKGIGVRIEECVLITDDGQEILTQQSPINPVAIEGLMRN